MLRVVQPLNHVGRTPKGAARSEPHCARETPGLLQCQDSLPGQANVGTQISETQLRGLDLVPVAEFLSP